MDPIGIALFTALAMVFGYFGVKLHSELRVVLLLIFGAILAIIAESVSLSVSEGALLYFALLSFSLYIFEYAPLVREGYDDYVRKTGLLYTASSLVASLIAGYVTYIITDEPILYVFAFSLLIFATQVYYPKAEGKVTSILNFESAASITLILGLLFAFFDISTLVKAGMYGLLLERVLLSAGIGILSGMVLLRFATAKKHHNILSFLIIIAVFLISERVAMPGLALLTSAAMFSAFETKRTAHTFDFLKKINSYLEIPILIIAGFLFRETITVKFILLSLTIYAVFFFLRFFANSFFPVSMKERIFLTLNSPKGAVGALLFILLSIMAPRYDIIWSIFFSQIIISEIVSYLSHSLENPHSL